MSLTVLVTAATAQVTCDNVHIELDQNCCNVPPTTPLDICNSTDEQIQQCRADVAECYSRAGLCESLDPLPSGCIEFPAGDNDGLLLALNSPVDACIALDLYGTSKDLVVNRSTAAECTAYADYVYVRNSASIIASSFHTQFCARHVVFETCNYIFVEGDLYVFPSRFITNATLKSVDLLDFVPTAPIYTEGDFVVNILNDPVSEIDVLNFKPLATLVSGDNLFVGGARLTANVTHPIFAQTTTYFAGTDETVVDLHAKVFTDLLVITGNNITANLREPLAPVQPGSGGQLAVQPLGNLQVTWHANPDGQSVFVQDPQFTKVADCICVFLDGLTTSILVQIICKSIALDVTGDVVTPSLAVIGTDGAVSVLLRNDVNAAVVVQGGDTAIDIHGALTTSYSHVSSEPVSDNTLRLRGGANVTVFSVTVPTGTATFLDVVFTGPPVVVDPQLHLAAGHVTLNTTADLVAPSVKLEGATSVAFGGLWRSSVAIDITLTDYQFLPQPGSTLDTPLITSTCGVMDLSTASVTLLQPVTVFLNNTCFAPTTGQLDITAQNGDLITANPGEEYLCLASGTCTLVP